MLDSFFYPISKCLATHLFDHRFFVVVVVNGAPRALIAKTKNNQSQVLKPINTFKRSYILASCVGTNGRAGAQDLKPPLLNHATSYVN